MKYKFFFLILFFASCQRDTLHYAFRPLPRHTWGMRDTLTFPLDSLSAEAPCSVSVCLRLGKRFPYRTLWVVLEQQYEHPYAQWRDTVEIPIPHDAPQGGGHYLQVEHPSAPLHYATSHRATLRLWHIMRREDVPEVWDAGIRIAPENK